MSHANAALTPRARLTVARLVVDQGVPISEVAARFQCSWPTVKRWADRYRCGQPMTDRSSRPRTSPAKTTHDDETACTATGVLRRAVAWFAARGITVEQVLSDNGGAYRSHLWRHTCADLGIRPRRTRPYRPQTNGKVERFHRTLADGWGYARCYTSEAERRAALAAWIHEYNHHRPHTACGNHPPLSRLTNLSGQYN